MTARTGAAVTATTSAWTTTRPTRYSGPPHRLERRPRPLVSAAYQARMAAARAGGTAAAGGGVGEVAGPGGSRPVPSVVTEERWEGRPVLGTLIRVGAMAIPVLAAMTSAVVASRLVSRPSGAWVVGGWFLLITAVSTVTLFMVDRVARRLLPLAALLKLSMAFPDRAPSRFSVAFKAGTTRHLKERLEEARQHGIHDEPARSAERILTLVGALSSHDRGTRGHSERVRVFNDLIAEEMGLSQADRDRLRWAALLHDIGKLHTPKRILNKPSAPTPKEWEQLRRHPEDGARIAAPLARWLGPWGQAIAQHHERWDGGGYPRGLAGDQIGLAARIVAVADAFEVITSPRPYKRPVNAHAARAELARCAGSHFDPAVVRAFLNLSIGRLRWAMGPISWLGQLPLLGSVPRVEGLAIAAGRSAAFAAGTATGVGAMALSGIIGPSTAAATASSASGQAQTTVQATGQSQPLPPAPDAASTPPSASSAPTAGQVPVAASQPWTTSPSTAGQDEARTPLPAPASPHAPEASPAAEPAPVSSLEPDEAPASGPDSYSGPGKGRGKGKGRGHERGPQGHPHQQ